MIRLALALLMVAPLAVGAQQEPLKAAPAGERTVSWADSAVRAKGAGPPDLMAQNSLQARAGAERRALKDALKNLMVEVMGLPVDGVRKVGDLMLEKDEIRRRVEGIVGEHRVVSKRYFSDSGVEVEVELPLALFADVVDPDATQVRFKAKARTDKSITGLVIDARGLNVAPCLLPRLVDESGQVLYSIDWLRPQSRTQRTPVAYVRSSEAAQRSPRSGDRPLIIRAESASGSDLRISKEASKQLAETDASFLAEGNVIIVMGELKPSWQASEGAQAR